ncbi:MAG: hypothetical protein LC132_06890 [Burkholderiales bacterium]|nr:hypothetical protein [Burkholderiales bacterium]
MRFREGWAYFFLSISAAPLQYLPGKIHITCAPLLFGDSQRYSSVPGASAKEIHSLSWYPGQTPKKAKAWSCVSLLNTFPSIPAGEENPGYCKAGLVRACIISMASISWVMRRGRYSPVGYKDFEAAVRGVDGHKSQGRDSLSDIFGISVKGL